MSNNGIATEALAPAETGSHQRHLQLVESVTPNLGAAMLSNAYTDAHDLPDVCVEASIDFKPNQLFAD